MKVGGSELGCVGSWFRWVMSCDVKLTLADSAPVQAKFAVTGEELPEFPVGLCARERSLGRGCARGTQLSVYIVRNGIS